MHILLMSVKLSGNNIHSFRKFRMEIYSIWFLEEKTKKSPYNETFSLNMYNTAQRILYKGRNGEKRKTFIDT